MEHFEQCQFQYSAVDSGPSLEDGTMKPCAHAGTQGRRGATQGTDVLLGTEVPGRSEPLLTP